MHYSLLLLVPTIALALPQQVPFLASPVPPLNPAGFPGHTLIALNDGSFVPSPAFGVGSVWKHENVTDLVISALEVGYRHIDNAAYYGNEEDVATAIRAVGLKREEVYLTTKYDGLNGRDIETEFLDSLRKLNTSYIDQYLVHNPRLVPIPSLTWPILEGLVRRGLIRTIGVSNYGPEDLSTLLAIPNLSIPPAINQVKFAYNTIQTAKMRALSKKHRIITAAYSILAPLTTESGGPVDEVAKKVAEEERITEGQVLLNWVKWQGLAVVTTSGKEFRQREQLAVFADDFPPLSKAETKALNKAGKDGELQKY